MDISSSAQIHQLFLSCGLGFLLGVYYDVFRVTRLIVHSGARSVFIQDLLFFLSSAVVTFLFALAVMDGRLRFYLFFGEIIGFASYYFTIGRLVMRFAERIISAIIFFWKKFWHFVFTPFRLLFRPICRFFNFLDAFIRKIGQKGVSNLKKGLKGRVFLLYNQRKVSGTSSGTAPRALHKKGKKG
ncbi:MAG: spore cortex biosynthesis protein YabQ [Oscillospiraceae bacterium]|nr:spore cortex biosynthesis protein YabQ [Oscillospiraceae bacterium]